MTPRGIRNNNPGNIRKSPIQWKGEVEGEDTAFETFVDPVHGLRAIARILLRYRAQGFDTVEEIIDRWAPPVENDTGAYVRAVASAAGISPTYSVNDALLPFVMKGIVQHENGQQPYPDTLFEEAIKLARV